jgi:Ca2+-binding RTX toxin-like protein
MEILLPLLLIAGLGFLFLDDGEATENSGTAGDGDEGETPDEGVTPVNNILNFTEDGDTALGTDGNDVMRGLGGDDFIIGGEGNDNIFAGDGDDTVTGQEGDDRIFLGRGDDVSSNSDAFS